MSRANAVISAVHVRRNPAQITLLVLVCVLCIMGVIMIADTTYPLHKAVGTTFWSVALKPTLGLLAGLAAMAIAYMVTHRLLRRIAMPAFWLSFGLLCLVLVSKHFAKHELNASRWLKFGPVTFQPSEIAKLTLILFIAHMLSRPDCKIQEKFRGLFAPLIAGGLCIVTVLLEPDLGTSVVMFATLLALLYTAGANIKHLAVIVIVLTSIVGVKLHDKQMDRINVFTGQNSDKQGASYETYQSWLAVGTGKMFGLGLGRGRGKFFIPQANDDYIFTTIAEEFGFVGSTVAIVIFGTIGLCGIVIARQASDTFSRLVATGITVQISIQALINIGVVIGMVPSTGLPLPFVSNGLTSLFVSMISAGLLLRIAESSGQVRNPTREEEKRVISTPGTAIRLSL